ncbi:carbohydrate ABC transporter permease [Saliphagus infecundisoli]|uniref:Carbohydrate ABC transporter permease n=1 Tax=Saliphagus infecundisoli TaxID=1849069 RepID=A0ABD5QAT8_9EURY|nr:sugar ABC transporter permease [Saliphagus infecundisoli]
MSKEQNQRHWLAVHRPVLNYIERLNETQFAYLLLIPSALVLGLIAIWPLIRTFEMSLHADALLSPDIIGEFVGLQNYIEVITGQRDSQMGSAFFDPSNPFQSALLVTFIFTIVSVFFETIIGFGQALVLDKEFKGRRWARVAIIMPLAIPIVIQGMIFFLMFQPNIGFLAAPLQELGLFSAAPLSQSLDATVIIIVADIWKTSAFMALLILAGLQSIDRNLYNVAKVAGATPWQRFKRITLPLVLPMVLIAMLFRTIQALRVYGLIETVASCNTIPSLSCMVVSTFSNGLYGTSATVAFIIAAIIAIAVSGYIWRLGEEAVV